MKVWQATPDDRRVRIIVGYLSMATVTFSCAAVISPGLAGVLFCLIAATLLGWYVGYRAALRRMTSIMVKEIESDASS